MDLKEPTEELDPIKVDVTGASVVDILEQMYERYDQWDFNQDNDIKDILEEIGKIGTLTLIYIHVNPCTKF